MTTSDTDPSVAREFVQFAVEAGVLRFGEFKTKAGRLSPYFFNSGLFDDGAKLLRLGEFYARRLVAVGLAFDMLFGPAYKGITLAAAVALEFARRGPAVRVQPQRGERSGEGGHAGRRWLPGFHHRCVSAAPMRESIGDPRRGRRAARWQHRA
jgi:orotate phosphoribosyltransferase